MDNQQIIAPSRARSGGVVHVKVRHSSHFTVVGNHLAQHCELSLIAIGLATHIQSLPSGAKVGIKFLVERFPESEARITNALRELEEHGYLQRTRERLPSGRVVTRTTSYNQPCSAAAQTAPAAKPGAKKAPSAPARATKSAPIAPNSSTPSSTPSSPPEPPSAPPTPSAPPKPTPPLPRPETPSPALDRTASALLLDLNRRATAFDLSDEDVRTLTPAVAAWLEREATPAVIRRVLTTDLPVPVKHPVKFLGHRLTKQLPPPLPPTDRPPLYDPLQNCDECDRAFRAPEPGNCAECRRELAATA